MKRYPTYLILLTVALSLIGGVLLDRTVLPAVIPPSGLSPDAAPAFHLMTEAWNTLEQHYVDRAALQPQRLADGAISGMVDALGDTGHSRFLTAAEAQQEQNALQGQFVGIGAEIQQSNGQLVVVAPLDGSPAQQAGLRPGDVILRVNGADITNLPLEQVLSQIQGPAGTAVTLTLLDPATGHTRDVTLVRAQIALHNITWQRLPGTSVAHLRLAAFSQGVGAELRAALADMQQHLTGIILDLRNDPGGLLDEAIAVASQFLRSGNVLLEQNAQGQITPMPAQAGGAAPSIPLVVLVNQGTASSAEVVTGELRDAHRATIVGATTFGTGTVLNQFALSDGSVLLVATEEWLTPNGRTIWHHGLTPDDVVALPPNALPLRPETEQAITPEQLRTSTDTQLLRALDLLAPTNATDSR
ncbi:MAG: S41 family peptidase [Roseiflexaceae bacterium]